MQNYPSWALWIAKDEDGACWAYEAEPHPFHKGWYENEVGRYEKVACPKVLENKPWQDALVSIKLLA